VVSLAFLDVIIHVLFWLTSSSLVPNQIANALLPVYVYIHGGSLIMGAGSDVYSDPKSLALETNAVAVTINYRLTAFGFMALRSLSADAPNNKSGNFGFMDQVAALQWIQANIRAFGGDPK
jgi:para-nitrobenzyl esterase